MRKLLFILFGFILLTSCGGNGSKTPSSEAKTTKTKITSPCSFLSEAEIKDVLSLPQDAPTTMEDVEYTLDSFKKIKKKLQDGEYANMPIPDITKL